MRMSAMVLCAALAFPSGGSTLAAEDAAPVVLGGVFDMTGDGAAYGVPSSRGAELRVRQINEAGGVLGRKLELSITDAASNDGQTKQAVRDQLDADPEPVALFGLSESGPALIAGKESASGERLFLTSGATSPKLPSEVPGYLFLACFGDNVQAAAAADYAYGKLSARTAAVLYDDGYTYTNLLQGYFREAFEGLGGETVSLVSFKGPEGFTQVLDRIGDADIVFLAAETPQDALKMVGELRAKGFEQPVVGGDGFDGEEVWQGHEAISGVYYTTHAYFGADRKEGPAAAFSDAYAAAHDGERPNGFAGLGYDAAGLLAHAIETAGSDDPDAVRAALANTTGYQGVTGTISYVDGSPVPLKSVTVMGIDKGKPVFQEEVLPKSVPKP